MRCWTSRCAAARPNSDDDPNGTGASAIAARPDRRGHTMEASAIVSADCMMKMTRSRGRSAPQVDRRARHELPGLLAIKNPSSRLQVLIGRWRRSTRR
jgi:hypothetical protein